MATGYDLLLDTEPELARTMTPSVTQRIAYGEQAGQDVQRIGSGSGYARERPELTGSRCASVCFCKAEDVNRFSLHVNSQGSAQRRDQLEHLMRTNDLLIRTNRSGALPTLCIPTDATDRLPRCHQSVGAFGNGGTQYGCPYPYG